MRPATYRIWSLTQRETALADYLNDFPDQEGKDELIRLYELLREYFRKAAKKAEASKPGQIVSMIEDSPLALQAESPFLQIEEILRGYIFRPALHPSFSGGRRPGYSLVQMPPFPSSPLGGSLGNFVLSLLDLFAQGRIEHLRRCRLCSRWFVAAKGAKVHCSDKCAEAYYDSEEYRQGERERAKDARKRDKEREESANKQARAVLQNRRKSR
jgi:hypothetical protein